MNRAESIHQSLVIDSNLTTTGSGVPLDTLILFATVAAGVCVIAIIVIILVKKR
jgi:hypothetical protein